MHVDTFVKIYDLPSQQLSHTILHEQYINKKIARHAPQVN